MPARAVELDQDADWYNGRHQEAEGGVGRGCAKAGADTKSMGVRWGSWTARDALSLGTFTLVSTFLMWTGSRTLSPPSILHAASHQLCPSSPMPSLLSRHFTEICSSVPLTAPPSFVSLVLLKAGPAGPSTQGQYTTAGGYTPIPDQQSMGGVGAGDVYIDACGETVPVSQLSPWQFPLALCCPCCIGDPCSDNRRRWYTDQLQTFIGVISMLQIIVFCVELMLGGWGGLLEVPSPVLSAMGGKVAPLIAEGQYWRLLTPIMLHAGFFHLAVNVFTQCMFGIQLEREWGALQIAVIYIVSGFWGNILSVIWLPESLSIGCSGAVFGLFGAQCAYILGMWRQLGDLQKKMLFLSLGVSFLFIMLFSISAGVDLCAHFGGFISGNVIALGFFSHLWPEGSLWEKYGKYIAFGATGVTAVFAVIYMWHNAELGYEYTP